MICARCFPVKEHFSDIASGSIPIYGIYFAVPFIYDRDGEHEGRVTSYVEDFATCNEKDWKNKRREDKRGERMTDIDAVISAREVK